MNEKKTCPVCGSAEEPEGMACPACGFAWRGAARFSGRGALAGWQGAVQRSRAQLLESMQAVCTEEGVLSIVDGCICLRLPRTGEVLLDEGGRIERLADGVRAVSSLDGAARNRALLMADGTVRTDGDGEFGQGAAEGMRDVVQVLATASCTYGLTRGGAVLCAGQPVSAEVARWRNVRALAGGAHHIAGLVADGRVLLARDRTGRAFAGAVEGWTEVQAIASSDDALMGRTAAGRVVFASVRAADRRAACTAWRDVVAVDVERGAAVGLTRAGRVLVAGAARSGNLDQGRAEAATWENVVAIACGRSSIAALDSAGHLHVAGAVRDAARTVEAADGLAVRLHDELVACYRARA